MRGIRVSVSVSGNRKPNQSKPDCGSEAKKNPAGYSDCACSWKRLQQLADSSADVVATELAKKIAHFADVAKRLSKKRTQLLLTAKIEGEEDEDTVTEGLTMPSVQEPFTGCANSSLKRAAFTFPSSRISCDRSAESCSDIEPPDVMPVRAVLEVMAPVGGISSNG
jgi:hypothetical protein